MELLWWVELALLLQQSLFQPCTEGKSDRGDFVPMDRWKKSLRCVPKCPQESGHQEILALHQIREPRMPRRDLQSWFQRQSKA